MLMRRNNFGRQIFTIGCSYKCSFFLFKKKKKKGVECDVLGLLLWIQYR